MITRYLKNHHGQAMSEYLILVMLVAVAAITVSTKVGKTITGKLQQINSSIQNTVTLEAVRGDGG